MPLPHGRDRAIPSRWPLLLAALLACSCLALPAIAQEEQEADVPSAQAVPPVEEAPAADDAYPGVVNPLEAERLGAALAALTERSRMVEAQLLDTARSYRRAAQQRSDSLTALAQASHDVDRAAVRPRELTAERLEQLAADADTARLRFLSDDRQVERKLDELSRLVSERDALALRIADLRSRLPQQQELLTGVWEVTWMPAGITGTFYIDQSGTLVTGQYQLGPLGSGSLQGTFVSGKLFLQRVDAERGRDAEIEGLLDADGRRIRGTWQSYELVQGGIPQGQWVARRLQ